MRRWNGWGDDTTAYPLAGQGVAFIRERIGAGRILDDASLDQVIARVPASHMPEHPLLDPRAETRLRHARGQSLPDWLALRSGNIGSFPDAVAFPECRDDVVDLLDFAARHDALVIPYGGGTSVVGHINPPRSDKPVLTIALTRMCRLLDLDETSLLATFGAGVAGPDLEAQLRARGYLLGHFPQSFELSTLGGWVASRSSGQQSLRYGRIEQLFAGGTLVTPRGILDIPAIPASSAGPDLREWVMGSEGRIGILTDVTVRISRLPQSEQFHVAFLPGWEQGVAAMRALAQARPGLSMLRLSNATETATQLVLAGKPGQVGMLEKYLALRGAGEGKCMLSFGITGDKGPVRFARRRAGSLLKQHGAVLTGQMLGRKWQHSRFRSPYLRETLWQLGYVVDTLETAVNWDRVSRCVDAIETALRGAVAGLRVHAFTHLSHVYAQGSSIYTSYVFPCAADYEQTLAQWRQLKHAASLAVVGCGGTISHQHGVGADHAQYLPAEKGELGIAILRDFCEHLDPERRMNPGKLLRDA